MAFELDWQIYMDLDEVKLRRDLLRPKDIGEEKLPLLLVYLLWGFNLNIDLEN
jgi:hypothetical protein